MDTWIAMMTFPNESYLTHGGTIARFRSMARIEVCSPSARGGNADVRHLHFGSAAAAPIAPGPGCGGRWRAKYAADLATREVRHLAGRDAIRRLSDRA